MVLGKKTEDGLVHKAGEELIFSAPKSVSIMALVAKDERLIRAHEKAVQETIKYLEKTVIQTRIQEDGKKRIENTGNSLIAKFTHSAARPSHDKETKEYRIPDPQLHTHCLIANATLCKDNKWRSIEFEKLYKDKMLLGELYRMELGREVEKLGYTIEKCTTDDVSKRQSFHIKGVPDDVMLDFSKRRQDILKEARGMDRFDAKALDFIARVTRGEKMDMDLSELDSFWQKSTRMDELKQTKDKAYAMGHKDHESRNFTKDLKSALSHLTERDTVFKEKALMHAILDANKGMMTIKELEKTRDDALKEGKLRMTKDKESYTTPWAIRLEKELLALLKESHNKVYPIETYNVIREKLFNTTLTKGQKEAISLVLATKDRVVGIQGAAGTGKTTALKELKTLLGDKGMHLIGVAPSKEASRVLKDEAGIHAETLQALLLRYDGFIKGRGTEKGLSQMKEAYKNTVLVCDESSLSGNRQLAKLLKLSQAFDLRLVLLGDKKQLSGVEAGKPFHLMQNNGLKTATMTDILRQKNTELKKSCYCI